MSDETPTMTPSRTLSPAAWSSADEEALLMNMVQRYSPSGHERPLAEWLAGQIAPLGLHAHVDAVGNLIAELPPSEQSAPQQAPLILLGHLDTVSGYILPSREDGRLYGRGAVDAKGTLAAFLAAMVRLQTRDMPRRRPIIVVGAVEEEAATSRGARAVLDRWRPAAVVIGEPSGAGAVTLAYKGRLLVRCQVTQAVAHTARPEQSVCARAVTLWRSLEEQAVAWNERHSARTTFATLQPSLRAINSSSDGLLDECALEIGYRLPPGFEPETLARSIEELALAQSVAVAFRGSEPAYEGARHNPLVSAFVRAIRAEGMTPGFKRKTGTSDMNVVGPIWRCPILAYGPGDATWDHRPDEHLSLAEYARAVSVLERALADLVGASGHIVEEE
jgi:N-acetyl-ornithine/N-acetyl-lysine deacetylase